MGLSVTSALTPAERLASRQLPRPGEPASELARYGRMLRPFPTRQLSDALYHVEAHANGMTQVLRNLLIDPPQTAEPWLEALYALLDGLDGLILAASEARAPLERMIDTADADAERAAVAMRAITSMLSPGSADDGSRELCPMDGDAS